MRDDFNFEETLGLLTQSFENKKYYESFKHLEALVAHPGQRDAVPVILGALDFLSDKISCDSMIDKTKSILDNLKAPSSDAEKKLQEGFVQKWTEALDKYTASSPSNTLQHMTWANWKLEADHPLHSLALAAWEKLVEDRSVGDYGRENALRITNEITNPDFRKAVLTKIAAHSSENPDETLEALDAAMKEMVFYQFSKTDKDSADLLLQTMTDILKDRADQYAPAKIIDIGWSILVRGEGFGEAGAKTTAGIYLEAAKKLEAANPESAFNAYHGFVERTTLPIPAEAEEAANRILDLAEAGKIDGTDFILAKIFFPAHEKGEEGEALAGRAAAVLFPELAKQILTADRWDFNGPFNNALFVAGALPAGDPVGAELLSLCKDGLKVQTFKDDDTESYVSKMGWLLDVAVRKEAAATVKYAETEWAAGVEILAAKSPVNAYEYVKKEYGQETDKQSPSRALAKAILPELEARAGVKSVATPVGGAAFLKQFGKGSAPKP